MAAKQKLPIMTHMNEMSRTTLRISISFWDAGSISSEYSKAFDEKEIFIVAKQKVLEYFWDFFL